MQYQSSGRHGLILSALGLDFRASARSGLGRGAVRELLAAVVDSGINYFHTRTAAADADMQRLLGELISDLHLPRDCYCLGAQLGAATAERPWPTQRGLSRKALRESCDQTLRRLDVEYLDLVLCEAGDPATPLAETLLAMDDLIRQGKVLYWGLTGWSAEGVAAVQELAALESRRLPIMLQRQTRQPAPADPAQPSRETLSQLAEWTAVGADGPSATAAAVTDVLTRTDLGSLIVPCRRPEELAGWLDCLPAPV